MKGKHAYEMREIIICQEYDCTQRHKYDFGDVEHVFSRERENSLHSCPFITREQLSFKLSLFEPYEGDHRFLLSVLENIEGLYGEVAYDSGCQKSHRENEMK